MKKYIPMNINRLNLPMEYKVFLANAANVARCRPEDIVCYVLREWVRGEGKDFAQMVVKESKKPP